MEIYNKLKQSLRNPLPTLINVFSYKRKMPAVVDFILIVIITIAIVAETTPVFWFGIAFFWLYFASRVIATSISGSLGKNK